jgi:hypothetical protein
MDLLPCISGAGILAFDDGFLSDHRTMFCDLDILKFFKGLSSDPVSPKSRTFTTYNYKRLSIINQQSPRNGSGENYPNE